MDQTIKTRLLIISDTHCAALKQRDDSSDGSGLPFEAPLPAADVLIHCGDMTHTGQTHEYRGTLDMLRQIDAPVKLVIAGNHDRSLDRDYVLQHLQHGESKERADRQYKMVRDLWTAPHGRAKMEGVTFLDEGLHIIPLPNGARLNVFATPYTPAVPNRSFSHRRDEDRFNPPSVSFRDAKNIACCFVPAFQEAQPPVDVMVTHGPPWDILDQNLRGDRTGCLHLLRAVMRARPLLHCFGHIHESSGARILEWSETVDRVGADQSSIEQWEMGAWKAGVVEERCMEVPVDLEKAEEQHATLLDATGLVRGRQTAMVNASIMNMNYKPYQSPWLIDLELPKNE